MRAYHILTHSMEPFYPRLSGPDSFASLSHITNRFVSNLMKYGKGRDYEHVMVNLSNSMKGKEYETTHRDGYGQIVLRTTFSIRDPLEFSLPLINFIRSRSPEDILHIHGTSSYIYDSIAPFLIGRKSVAHYRGGHLTLRAFPILFPKYVLFAPFTLRMPRLLFVQNLARMEKFHRNYLLPMERMVHLPNAVDVRDFAPDQELMESLRGRFSIREGDVNILFAGRIVRGKGISALLKAFRSVSERNPRARLLLAGKNYLGEIDAGPRVTFLGQLNFPEMRALYHLCGMLAHPSEYESFGNVIQEAMACSLPVVATATEGAMDQVQDGKTGFLVKVGDGAALADRLTLLASDESLRRKMGAAGRERVEKEFGWPGIARKVFDSYGSLP